MKERFCPVPFQHARIGMGGEVNICCKAWVKGNAATVGHVTDSKLDEIWNSEAAQEFRSTILDGSFRHCDSEACPSFTGLPKKDDIREPHLRKAIDENETRVDPPRVVALNYDKSCTLSCPMCRKEKIMISGKKLDETKLIHDRVVDYLDNPEQLIVTGIGDAFGSKIFRDFLATFDRAKFRDTRLVIRTNSDIFTEKMWNFVSACHDNIHAVEVSVDATREKSYSIIRRGGDFSRLSQNMDFVGGLRASGAIPKLTAHFAVQLHNFEEVDDMIRLGERWNLDVLAFNQLRPGGEIIGPAYTINAVHRRSHPRFQDFVEVMASVKKDAPFAKFAPGLLQHLPREIRSSFAA